MDFINQSITRRIVFWTVLPLFVLSIIAGIYQVSGVKDSTQKRVETGINNIVKVNATEIRGFLKPKAKSFTVYLPTRKYSTGLATITTVVET